jgi:hydroxyacylglutathione hydrolase
MLLRYFYDTKLAHASYLVGCQRTGEALIVDPDRDVEIYLKAAKSEGMRITGVAETHIHADFVSGARELAERAGAMLHLSDAGDENWKYRYANAYRHRLLNEGDTFKVGNIKFEVMHTPGHTPEHISLLLTDTAGADRPMGIFSGDFVFVGDVGRPDLLEKAVGVSGTAEAGARQMFKSLQRFKALPDYLQVWPAHGAGSACGKALGAVPSSTAGYEKMFNWAMQPVDEEKFVTALLDGQPEPPKYFAMMKKVNKEGPQLLDASPKPEQLPVERLNQLLEQNAAIVDTRHSLAFANGHIPGTINIPHKNDFINWAGWFIDYAQPFYLIAAAARIENILKDLSAIGLDNVGGYFDVEALKAWPAAGQPLQTYGLVTPHEVAKQVMNGQVTLLDVRNLSEWQAGRIRGATHLMLGYLVDRLSEVPNDKPIIVQCRSGNRSAIAASLLQARGFGKVSNLVGGINEWAAAGLPVMK